MVQNCSAKRSGEQRPSCWQLRCALPWVEKLMGGKIQIKGETPCSALEQKRAWMPSLKENSCRDHGIPFLPPTHAMKGTFSQVLA